MRRCGGAKLHGTRQSDKLSVATEAMADALRASGTSFDALYVNGYFGRSLAVYGQECLPCNRMRPPDPPRAVHEPVVLLLPPLPTPPPDPLKPRHTDGARLYTLLRNAW